MCNSLSRVIVFALLLLILVQCTPANSTPSTPIPTRHTQTPLPSLPQLTPLPPQRRGQSVVLVTLTGARADYVEKWMAAGALPALARISSLGVRADYLQPIDPPTGAAAQMSMLTGASPARTGIVADNLRKAGQPIGQSSSGFDLPSNVEPIWRSVMRYGAKTALVGYPVSALNLTSQRADLMVSTGAVVAPSAQHVLKFGDAKDWKNAPASFSLLKEARSAIPQSGAPPLDLFVLALDTTNDKQDNYDAWLFSRTKTVDDNAMRLRLNEWGAFVVDPLLQSSAAFKVTDANPAHFAVYQSAVMLNQIVPVDLAREVTRRLGPPPAPADADAYERNWIEENTFLQMSERQSEWLVAAGALIYQQYAPDLLLLRLTGIADAERELLLSEARQLRYSPERAQNFARVLQRAYELSDAALGKLFIQLDSNTNALLVVSDRGMAPVHTVVNLNRLLMDRKWLTLQRGAIDVPKSKAYAEASEGIAHIYISLKGRDTNGAVEPVDYDKLQSEIVGALRAFNDPVDGQPIFARVLRKQELGALGLQNDNSGDVVVQARAGFVFSGARERNAVLEPASFSGASGFDANSPQMRGIFSASGAGIRAGARLLPVHALDIAPTIASLLRITPPTFIEGKAIQGALR